MRHSALLLAFVGTLLTNALSPQVGFAKSGGEINPVYPAVAAEPVPAQTLMAAFASQQNLSQFEAAVRKAGLRRKLEKAGPYTVFAPTNEAFDRLPATTRRQLMSNQNGALTQLLKYYVVEGQYAYDDLRDGQMLTTLEGHKLRVSRQDDEVRINGVRIGGRNLEAVNGLVHTLDHVVSIIND